MDSINITWNGYLITTDKSKLQPEAIHKWLSEESYWAKHIPYDLVKRAFDHSYCIGILKDNEQVGYARLITDYASFAYLADVYVTAPHRGQGLSKQMMQALFDQEWTKQLRSILLATKEAHGLYTQFGFHAPKYPERMMQLSRPAIYGDTNNSC